VGRGAWGVGVGRGRKRADLSARGREVERRLLSAGE